MSLIILYTLSKHQKTRGFVMFSGGIERDQWHEMGLCCIIQQCLIHKLCPYKDKFHRRIQNPVEHLRWTFLWKQLTTESFYLFSQITLSQMFDWVLNIPLSLFENECTQETCKDFDSSFIRNKHLPWIFKISYEGGLSDFTLINYCYTYNLLLRNIYNREKVSFYALVEIANEVICLRMVSECRFLILSEFNRNN